MYRGVSQVIDPQKVIHSIIKFQQKWFDPLFLNKVVLYNQEKYQKLRHCINKYLWWRLFFLNSSLSFCCYLHK